MYDRIKPFTSETKVPGIEILGIEKEAPLLERFKYRVRYPACGHEGILGHRTIKNRIRLGGSSHEYTGLCPTCSRSTVLKEKRKTRKPKQTLNDLFHQTFGRTT